MLVFNNQQRSGYEEIASYSPRYYRNIKEMDAVFRLAGWLLDIMARDMENIVASQFLRFMNEEALDRYECFLGIKRKRGSTLEERKAYIRAMLLGSGKMSMDMIVAIINQYEECECKVGLEGFELNISMSFKDNNDKYVEEIQRLIRIKGPAHLNYRFTIIFHYMTADNEETVMEAVMLKTVRFAVKMPFLPYRSYDGTSKFDGTMRYDAKRRYRLSAGLRVHCRTWMAEEYIGNLALETRRNVQYYDGKRHYDGTTKYNALIRKDVIE